jgi:hypothetical protein
LLPTDPGLQDPLCLHPAHLHPAQERHATHACGHLAGSTHPQGADLLHPRALPGAVVVGWTYHTHVLCQVRCWWGGPNTPMCSARCSGGGVDLPHQRALPGALVVGWIHTGRSPNVAGLSKPQPQAEKDQLHACTVFATIVVPYFALPATAGAMPGTQEMPAGGQQERPSTMCPPFSQGTATHVAQKAMSPGALDWKSQKNLQPRKQSCCYVKAAVHQRASCQALSRCTFPFLSLPQHQSFLPP